MSENEATNNAESGSTESRETDTGPLPSVARVAFRVPPFWEKNPTTWFRQLESQCVLSGCRIARRVIRSLPYGEWGKRDRLSPSR